MSTSSAHREGKERGGEEGKEKEREEKMVGGGGRKRWRKEGSKER